MHIPDMTAWLKDTRNRGILAAVGVILLIVLYSAGHHSPSTTVVAPTMTLASSTSLVAGTGAASTAAAATTSATSSPAKTSAKSPLLDSTSPAAAAQASNLPAQQLTASGGKLLRSLVNIVCVSGDPSIPSISGSGVIIDSRGIILTAAHVAQFFLLQDYLGSSKVECIIRTGSPARRAYLGEPIYVSPSWVLNNLTTISTPTPKGTGENDFALIGITATATSTPLASSFPAIPLAPNDPQLQEPVAIGSYGAQYLTASELNYDLYPILVFGSIQSRYTFNTNTVDIVSIMGSAASQEGSSGGGIVDASGELQGVITTSTIAGDIAARSLNAITVGHIRRSYYADTGENIDSILQSNSVSTLIASFANESQLLGQKLVSANGL